MTTNKYQRGKIYVIRNCIDEEVYVGSTYNSLHKRFMHHKKRCKYGKSNMKFHKHMKKLGFHNFHIELFEEYPCETMRQLHRREGQVQRELKSSLNVRIAGHTHKEWYQDNKNEIRERHRKHYQRNKDEILERHRKHLNKPNNFYGTNRNRHNFKARMKNWKPKLEIHLKIKHNLL